MFDRYARATMAVTTDTVISIAAVVAVATRLIAGSVTRGMSSRVTSTFRVRANGTCQGSRPCPLHRPLRGRGCWQPWARFASSSSTTWLRCATPPECRTRVFGTSKTKG